MSITWFIALCLLQAFWSLLRREPGLKRTIGALEAARRHLPEDNPSADVQVHAVAVSTYPGTLSPYSRIMIVFKNQGPTTASDVRLRGWLKFAHVTGTPRRANGPVVTMGSGETQSFASRPLRQYMMGGTFYEIRAGREPMTVFAEVDYADVFGSTHRTRYEAVYRAKERIFEMTKLEAN